MNPHAATFCLAAPKVQGAKRLWGSVLLAGAFWPTYGEVFLMGRMAPTKGALPTAGMGTVEVRSENHAKLRGFSPLGWSQLPQATGFARARHTKICTRRG